nr:hypothetical protein Iba_chr04cCG15150 [Ipomoea batatas]
MVRDALLPTLLSDTLLDKSGTRSQEKPGRSELLGHQPIKALPSPTSSILWPFGPKLSSPYNFASLSVPQSSDPKMPKLIQHHPVLPTTICRHMRFYVMCKRWMYAICPLVFTVSKLLKIEPTTFLAASIIWMREAVARDESDFQILQLPSNVSKGNTPSASLGWDPERREMFEGDVAKSGQP